MVRQLLNWLWDTLRGRLVRSAIADDEIEFENVFANGKQKAKPEPSQQHKSTKPPPKHLLWWLFLETWTIGDVQEQFGSDGYRSAINKLLDLKQTSTVEEDTTKFQSVQYDVTMHGSSYDPTFFATQYLGWH